MTETNQETPKTARKGIDKSKCLELREKHGLTYKQIGELQGVSKQAIHTALQPLLPDQDLIKSFQDKQADILSYAQFKALSAYLSLTDAEQKSMISRRGFIDMGIAFDKQRLLLGLSTANIAYDAPGRDDRIRQLRRLLGDADTLCQPAISVSD